jgi:hypothetical protein
MNPSSQTVLEIDRPTLECRDVNATSIRRRPVATAAQKPAESALVGVLVAITDSGTPLVDFPKNQTGAALPARSIVPLTVAQVGNELVLLFEDGRLSKPVIVGCIQAATTGTALEANVDGQRLIFTGQQEVVLRCGKASITLTKAGKILIEGEYVLSRSRGVNRIKGGSVQIN